MPVFSESDTSFMRQALELAARARGKTRPNPMVGAVLVKDGKIIGQGFHEAAGKPHAEVVALASATADPKGATMYVTLEPCAHQGKTPPCVGALVEKRVKRVVAPIADPDRRVSGKGFEALKAAGIKVDVGLCEAEASRLNEFFIAYHTLQRPFVISKWAMTLDGRIATRTGHSRWVTNEDSRRYVHELRSIVDAVMVGIGTILIDNPLMNVRLDDPELLQPKRVIIDGSLRTPLRAKVLENAQPGQCVLAATEHADENKVARMRAEGHTVLVLRGHRALVDLRQLFRELHRMEVQSVMCEGGSGLHGQLLAAHLVDKVAAFVSPKIIGGDGAKTPIAGWGVDYMHKALCLKTPTLRTFGEDICIEGYLADEFRLLTPLRSK